VMRGMLLVGLLLQGESVEGGSDVVVEDFGTAVFEDPKVLEKGGLPPWLLGELISSALGSQTG